MAIVVRYFSTSAAGAGDGTSWADRAAFYSGGAYSTIITGFDFSGSDSLEVRLGAGTYSAALTFQSSIFTVAAPRPSNPLTIHGCDSSGSRLSPSEWNCCQGSLPVTGYPVWELGGNSLNLANLILRCVSLTSSLAGSGFVLAAGAHYEYCRFENTANSTSVNGISASLNGVVHSCHVICSGTAFNMLCIAEGARVSNCRFEGNASATSGTRAGNSFNASVFPRMYSRNCLLNIPGNAFANLRSAADGSVGVSEMTIVNCATLAGTAAINGPSFVSTNTNTQQQHVTAQNCFIANCGTGLNTQNVAARILGNRIRCTTNYTVPANSIIAGNYEAAGSDADEFVDAASGDYRIKRTSIYWGKGIGAGDEMTASGTSRPTNPFQQQVIA